MVAKADGDEIADKEESGPNGAAATAGLKSSVIGATGNVAESRSLVFHQSLMLTAPIIFNLSSECFYGPLNSVK